MSGRSYNFPIFDQKGFYSGENWNKITFQFCSLEGVFEIALESGGENGQKEI
jgi:hypothetical protein